uniref:Uncharacterized protein n=1 Tax=Arundo donax TaxID=35708 RepID=A0A0A8XUS4_ARUDO
MRNGLKAAGFMWQWSSARRSRRRALEAAARASSSSAALSCGSKGRAAGGKRPATQGASCRGDELVRRRHSEVAWGGAPARGRARAVVRRVAFFPCAFSCPVLCSCSCLDPTCEPTKA